MRPWTRKSASIQPRTSLRKSAVSWPISLDPGSSWTCATRAGTLRPWGRLQRLCDVASSGVSSFSAVPTLILASKCARACQHYFFEIYKIDTPLHRSKRKKKEAVYSGLFKKVFAMTRRLLSLASVFLFLLIVQLFVEHKT